MIGESQGLRKSKSEEGKLAEMLLNSNYSKDVSSIFFTDKQEANQEKKSNLLYTRGITPKVLSSGGARLRSSARKQHNSEETSRPWGTVGGTVPI